MLPPKANLPKGHAFFPLYKSAFDEQYLSQEVYDFRGRRILFAQQYFNNNEDCAHAIYGKPKSQYYQQQFWNQKRADRIPWIGVALRGGDSYGSVTVLVSKDGVDPTDDTRVYLLKTRGDADDDPDEYYAVVAVVKDSNTLCFLTAYDVEEGKALRWYADSEREEATPKPKQHVVKAKKTKVARVTFKTFDEGRNQVRGRPLVPEWPLWPSLSWFSAVYDLPLNVFSVGDLILTCEEYRVTKEYLSVAMPRCLEYLERDPYVQSSPHGSLFKAVMEIPLEFWSKNVDFEKRIRLVATRVYDDCSEEELSELAMNFLSADL